MGKQKAPRRVGDNEALAVGTTIRGSAQKLNLVAGADPRPEGRGGAEHPRLLEEGDGARRAQGARQAIANAENNHNLDVDALVVAEASVGKSITMKRFATRGRGKSTPHPQAVQPAAHRRPRAARRPKHGSEEPIRSACACRSTAPGTAAGTPKGATTASCSRKTSRSASTSSRRCRRRRSRRW